MFVVDVLLTPYRATKLTVQAITDLHDIAERARQERDPFSQLRDAIVEALVDVDALAGRADSIDRHLQGLDAHFVALLSEVDRLIRTARTLIDGGAELTVTAKSLDGHAAELIDGGQDLTVTAKHLDGNAGQLNELAASLDSTLKLFQAALPQLLGALDTVEELEESIETVADTIEPLQATAEKVGRVTQRFSRGD